MADSRQTKIVEYILQGNFTHLELEIQNAINHLDTLDQKMTQIGTESGKTTKRSSGFNRAAAITQAETQIAKFRDLLQSANIQFVSPDQLNLLKFAGIELETIINKMNGFKNSSTVTQRELEKVVEKLRQMNYALNTSGIKFNETKEQAKSFATTLRSVFSTLATIRLLLNWFLKLYNASSEFIETMNLFNVAVQDSGDQMLDLAQKMSKAYSTDIEPILRSIAVFRQYGNTMGFAAEQADILSEGLTKVVYDLSSLYNVDYTDMLAAVKSGISGQTKALMRYGISVHKATLEQTALNLGLERSWTQYTETEKVALRYLSILEQASLAQGDLARTLESPSNQMKIATAQVQVFIRNLGTLITIVTQHVMPVFNGLMIAINNFLSAMNKAAGYTIPDYSDNLSATNQMLDEGTESANAYEDALEGSLAPLDEINQQNNEDGNILNGNIDPKILAALKSYDNLMGMISTKTSKLADAFSTLLNPELFGGIGSIAGVAFDTLGKGIDIVTTALTTLSPVIGGVLFVVGKILQGAGWLLDKIVNPLLSFVETLTSNIWLLVGAFVALNLIQLAVTGNWQSMIAVKMLSWFFSLTKAIVANTGALIANVAASIKAKVAQYAEAVAAWWAAAAWWQKAVAVIAAAGALALVVAGIVMTATATTSSTANSTMSETPNIPAMATGAVVTGPTVALIGEGRYNEMVMPLGNSPQFTSMKNEIADDVVRRLTQTPYSAYGQSQRNIPVILTVDGKEFARGILPSLSKTYPQTGVKFK